MRIHDIGDAGDDCRRRSLAAGEILDEDAEKRQSDDEYVSQK